MREDNVRVMDTAAESDKKQRRINIAYKAVCVLLAVLTLLMLVLMVAMPNPVISYEGLTVLGTILMSLMPAVMLATVVVALLNLKKEMPRLLMLFGGSMAFWGAYTTAAGWTAGLIPLAAGLAVLVVMYLRLEQLYREEPVAKVKSKTLIIAGVLSVLVALAQAFYAVRFAMILAEYLWMPQSSTIYFFFGLIYFAGSLGLAAACFAKSRKASVYYRMFFLGVMILIAGRMTNSVIVTLQLHFVFLQLGLAYISYINFISNAAALVVLVLVLVNTFRRRKQRALEAAPADAEQADTVQETATAENEEDDFDDTIGLINQEDDDFDETIGLYREDDADQ